MSDREGAPRLLAVLGSLLVLLPGCAGARTDPPQLVLLSAAPADGTLQLTRSSHFSFVFSEEVDPTTVTADSLTVVDASAGGGVVAGTRVVSGASVAFVPSAPLAYSSALVVTLARTIASRRASSRGGWLEGAPITLHASVVDPAPLLLLEASPADGETDVPVSAGITMSFSAPLDPMSVTPGSVSLAAGGAPVALSDADLVLDALDPAVLRVLARDPAAFQGSASHPEPDRWAHATAYTLTLAASIASVDAIPARSPRGTLEIPTTLSFVTTPAAVLAVVASVPAAGAFGIDPALDESGGLVLDFSEGVNPLSLTSGCDPSTGPCVDPEHVFVNPGSASSPSTRLRGVSLGYADLPGAHRATLLLGEALASGAEYTLTVLGCSDLKCATPGVTAVDPTVRPLAASYVGSFTTWIAPGLAAVDPADTPDCSPPGSVLPASSVTLVFTSDVECGSVQVGPDGTAELSHLDSYGALRFGTGTVSCDGVDPATLAPSAGFRSNRVVLVPTPWTGDCLDETGGLPADSRVTLKLTTGILRAGSSTPALGVTQVLTFCSGDCQVGTF